MNYLENQRYYLKGSKVPFEEDKTHEFKGHRSINHYEIGDTVNFYHTKNGKIKVTRRPVSNNICGMLNSRKGGTIYLGILDNGKVEGFSLTHFQIDHIRLSIYQTLMNFTPSVPRFMYDVKFVPVFEKNIHGEIEKFNPREMIISNYRSKLKKQNHVIYRSFKCWCDYEASAMISHGLINPYYVIEIEIKSWNLKDNFFQEIFENEEIKGFFDDQRLFYIRRCASNNCIKIKQEVLEIVNNME